MWQTGVLDESHTGANKEEVLEGVVAKWNLQNKYPSVVTDNASNLCIAASNAGISTISTHLPSIAHT